MKQKMPTAPSMARANNYASRLVELMLREMQRGLRHPQRIGSPEWNRIFGTHPVAAHVKTLVQTMALLNSLAGSKRTDGIIGEESDRPLNGEEMQQLQAWLSSQTLPLNGSCAEAESS